MSYKQKSIIAILLLIVAVFGSDFKLPNILPTPEPHAKILNIDTPTKEVIDRVSVFSDIVSDPDDRAKLAIFNYEFSQRVLSYETNSQQINDVYSLAGKLFFKETLVDKYDSLAENIISLLEEIIGKEDHILSEEEKQSISEYFKGVAWVLIHKG